jgi:hypothetical protein
MDVQAITESIGKIKDEKKKTLQRLREINKLLLEYEMRLFLLHKKKEISDPVLERKIQKVFNKS